MDTLSITTSIIAVLQLSVKVLGCLHDFKDASEDRAKCVFGISNVHSLLITLRSRLEDGSGDALWYTAIQDLGIENGPLDQFKQALEVLQTQMTDGGQLQQAEKALVWKFEKEEIDCILLRIERLKAVVGIALEMDHLSKLSEATHDDTKHSKLLEWISPTDYPAQQSDILGRRQKGTGQWFLDAPEFTRWLRVPKGSLFCPGIPGAGKTMMAAIAIEQLLKSAQSSSVGVAYLYLNYTAREEQDVSSMLAALIKQLVQGRPSIAEPVERLHKQHTNEGTKPSPKEIFSTLRKVVAKYSTVYIVVDALDECRNYDDTRRLFLARLRDLQTRQDVRLLATSRFIIEVEAEFKRTVRLEIQASNVDVRAFVAGQMYRLPKCIQRDPTLQKMVEQTISERADGRFLLARLHLDALLDKTTVKQVKTTLANLSKGLAALHDAYNTSFQRIESNPIQDSAKAALSWITFAQRPLTTGELHDALMVVANKDKSETNDQPNVDDVISACGGLVTVDRDTTIIRPVHHTLQEFLEFKSSDHDIDRSESVSSAETSRSVFSTDINSISSGTSYASVLNQSSVDAFATLLVSDHDIRSACVTYMGHSYSGPARLERRLRRLLYRFWKNLAQEATTSTQRTAVDFLQSKSRLRRIAKTVRHRVSGEPDILSVTNDRIDTQVLVQNFLNGLQQQYERKDERRVSSADDKGASDPSSSDDDDQDAEINGLLDFSFETLTGFLIDSRAFQKLKEDLQGLTSPDFLRELDNVSRRILEQEGEVSDKYGASLQSVISQLRSANPSSITVFDLQPSRADNWKRRIEKLSGVSWNWWPLQKPTYPILSGQTYLSWQCNCGDRRQVPVPTWVGNDLGRISAIFNGNSGSMLPTHTQKVSLQAQATPRNDRTLSQRGSIKVTPKGSVSPAHDTQSEMSGYVFVGVRCGDEHKIAEINVRGFGDDRFFTELRTKYHELKGYLRRYLSIWRYKDCDFVKFEKFDYESSVPRNEGMPEDDPEYVYVPKPRKPLDPMPPISPHEFETRFYSCYGGGQRHKHIIFSCHSEVCRLDNDGLERIPKRLKPLADGIPKRGYFWGLQVREEICFYMVALYNFLLLLCPFMFWICWLFAWNHPGDLQNASIPMAITAALLPMFWLPIFTNKEHNR